MIRFRILPLLVLFIAYSGCTQEPPSILVFSRTEGYRHDSIEPGIEALQKMASEKGFAITATEDPSFFADTNLREFDTIVFLCTTGDVLNPDQQSALQRYIQAGGGYLGIHSASDTEYDWPWYGQLVGGYFTGHPNNPNVREARLLVEDQSHTSTAHLPSEWIRTDEWYDFRDQYSGIQVLINIDETSYKRPEENIIPEPRPIAWLNNFDGGRAFYTALGHTSESWSEQGFLDHVWGGLRYTIGTQNKLDYSMSTVLPEENRFQKTVLDQNLNEPMELDFLDDDNIVFVERPGAIKVHTISTGTTVVAGTLPVSTFGEEGLIGVAADPNYGENNWIYLAYSDPELLQTHLARFDLKGAVLDRESETRLLSFAVDRDEACCHMGGSLEFDASGNLFMSVGDNTNPFASSGYNPIDERGRRASYDAQRSSSNSQDLRGKILRIKPQADGSYTIPDGNLFADESDGRPEIYVMGNRNPFRISIDDATGYLYWGEVGPDANKDDPVRGPKGYDEINQARQAGFFGWPYLIADNKPYGDHDFATGKSRTKFRAASLVNNSPNNSGIGKLPKAEPAYIWYPYDKSAVFPNLGNGGRTAMAGPVFHADDHPKVNGAFPDYYDGRLFIYDWIRDWVATVVMDEDGDLVRVDRFLESDLELSNPMDMLFGPDGSMYVLEYGASWNTRNLDARLSRLAFNSGNRAPIAKASASAIAGAVPFTVTFSAAESSERDGDNLEYEWDFDGDGVIDSREMEPSHTYTDRGIYRASVTVSDNNSGIDSATIELWAGNDPPQVDLGLVGNRSFYSDDSPAPYNVNVSDSEDGTLVAGTIDPDAVTVSMSFLSQGNDIIQATVGHKELTGATLGENLIAASDCLSCHQNKSASNGPAFVEIARRYADSPGASTYLKDKIISGGAGIWGDRPMAAHPDLADEDVGKMVDYIRSLANADSETVRELGLSGEIRFDQHEPASFDGLYIITASYRDSGNEDAPVLAAEDRIVLRSPYIKADRAVARGHIEYAEGHVYGTGYLSIGNMDLTGITSVEFVMSPGETSGRLSIKLDSENGAPVAAVDLSETDSGSGQVRVPVDATSGFHDVFVQLEGLGSTTAHLDQIVFAK